MISAIRTYLANRRSLRLLPNILSTHRFDNEDIGPLNDIRDIDVIVLSIPKCGTTALQRGFSGTNRKALHIHTNASLFNAFENGDILQNNALDVNKFIEFRLKMNSKRLFVFFGYREPVSWYLSLAGQFGLALDQTLQDNIALNIDNTYPWSDYGIQHTANIIKKSFRIDILKHKFDHNRGFTVIPTDRVDIILFKFDRLGDVSRYITNNIDADFVLRRERVNADPAYVNYRQKFHLPENTIQRLYSNKFFKHFYRSDEAERLMARYAIARPAQPRRYRIATVLL